MIQVVSALLSLGDLLEPLYVEGRWVGPPSPHCSGHEAAAATGAAGVAAAANPSHRPAELVVNCSLDATAVTQLVLRDNPKLSRLAFPTPLWESMAATLELLDASGCGLTALPDDLARLAALRHLDVSENGLTAVPAWAGKLLQLERLSLRGNPVVCGGDQLLSCPALTWVDLTGCPIAKTAGCGGLCGPELCSALEAKGCEVERDD